MSIDISIVILHYNDAAMTENYVHKLCSMNWTGLEYHIVIVDNASPDGSGALLKKTFSEADRITVILNRQNDGFAKGNNLGIMYCHERLSAELIAVSNNDILMEDPEFFQKLWKIYSNEKFAVAGPDIYSLGKEIHQSPIRGRVMTEEEVRAKIQFIDGMLKKLSLIKKLHLYDTVSKLKRILGKKPGIEGYQYEKKQTNVVLQGAFFVLSQKYMKIYPKGLYDETFLYMEEDILAYLCCQKGLEMLYLPDLKVKHIDGCATLKAAGDRCGKYIFELRETRKSCLKMLALMNPAE